MTYGSWSGGIFLLEIDPATEQPLYLGKTQTNEDGLLVDFYFGTKIGGGFRRFREGSFIVYESFLYTLNRSRD